MPVAIADVGSDGRRHATGRQLQGARGLQLQPPSALACTSQRRCPQGWWGESFFNHQGAAGGAASLPGPSAVLVKQLKTGSCHAE